MSPEQLRIQALQIAQQIAQQRAQQPGGRQETDDEIVARAATFAVFLIGDAAAKVQAPQADVARG